MPRKKAQTSKASGKRVQEARVGIDAEGKPLEYSDTDEDDDEVQTGIADLDTKFERELQRDRAKSRRKRRPDDALNAIVGTAYSITNAVIPFFTFRARQRRVQRYWPHRRLIIDFLPPSIDAEELAFRRRQCVENDHLYIPVPAGHSLVEAKSHDERENRRVIALGEVLVEAWGDDYLERLEAGGEDLPAGRGKLQERRAA